MAKLDRKTLVQFGTGGPSTSFGQFGSKTAGVPQTTKDPTIIQQLAAWVNGWQDAVVTANKAAYMEDMNGWCYVMSYMASYLFQQGIPEWDSGTTYFLNSVVQGTAALGNAGQWFNSLQDNNIGNAPPVSASNAQWDWINAPAVVPQAVAVGTIIDHAGGATPTGYLPCDGVAVSRVTYAALFAQIGVIWGAGDSVTTFNTPGLNRRVTVGSGGASTPTLGNAVGNIGGEEDHVLTTAEMPAHTHSLTSIASGADSNAGGPNNNTVTGAYTTGSTGGGAAHNNMQPSAVVVKLIKT